MKNPEHYLKQELDARLKENSQLFDWIEDGSLDGIWFWDLENQEHEWLSPRFKELFGYDENEIPHTSDWWQQNIFEEDLPAVLENFEKHCKDPSHPYDQVVRYRHKNGSTVWVRCRGKVMFNEEGKPIRMIGAHTDLTDLMQAKEEYKGAMAGKQAVFDAILDSILVINEKGIIQDINSSTERLFEYSREEIIGKNIKVLMDTDDASQHDRYLDEHIKTGKSKIIGVGREVMARKKSGELFYAFLSIAKYHDPSGQKFVGTLRDITDQVKQRLTLEFNALHDDLTALASRKLLEQRLEHAISESLREEREFCMFFIDLDKFKPVNDVHGHEVGDEVLKIVSKRLIGSFRANDLCARIGGDEFVILCEPTESITKHEQLSRKIKQCVSAPMRIGAEQVNISASVGVARFPHDGETKDALLRHADGKMYDEKRGKQNV